MPSRNITLYAKWNQTPFLYTIDEYCHTIITDILTDTKEVIIPSQIDGNDIISIDPNAFAGHSQITHLTIPDSVIYLPQAVLKDLTHLEYLKTPFVGIQRDLSMHLNTLSFLFYSDEYSGGISVVDVASYIPHSLAEVILTDSTTIYTHTFAFSPVKLVQFNEGVTTIEADAFVGSSIGIVPIPASVTSIHPSAFNNMVNLISIPVNESNPNYSGSQFGRALFNKDQTKLIRYAAGLSASEYTVPDGVLTIGDYAFSTSPKLAKVYLPDSVTLIDDFAFAHTVQLTSIEYASTSALKTIGRSAFENSSIVYISIPNTVKSIGDYAFKDAARLETVTFIDGSQLDFIGTKVFYGAWRLSEIFIPLSVNTIGEHAFGDLYKKLTLNCETASKPVGWDVNWHETTAQIVVVWDYKVN